MGYSDESIVRDTSELTMLLAEHGLVVVPGLIRDSDSFIEFVQQLGSVVTSPFLSEVVTGTGITRLEHSTSEGELRASGGIVFESGWHNDATFLEEPPAISILWCENAPEVGGDTVFCDASFAMTSFSDQFLGFLRTLHGVHSSGGSFSTSGAYGVNQVFGATPRWKDETGLQAVHPAIVTSPFSGDECVYLNPSYTQRLQELTHLESAQILELVFRTLFMDEHLVRLTWHDRMMVIWDNSRIAHRAVNQGVVGTRRMLHCNIRMAA
ncbi:TauD/TfdA family dioxygenase [Saccharopolyspora shandongensis]|uniref:TauD/TfdA dioxygenase family protein n=1 Tax=Saccharopolyspora shandongensis TaxID=418495 RepID=UPI003439115E